MPYETGQESRLGAHVLLSIETLRVKMAEYEKII